MKKTKYVVKFLIATSIITATCSPMIAHAAITDNTTNISEAVNLSEDQNDINVSDKLTYDQLIKVVMKNEGLSKDQAKKFIGPRMESRAKGQFYRTFEKTVKVKSNYKPKVRFYCKTSEWDGYRGIMTLLNSSINRDYDGTSKQFNGTLYTNLEDANTIYFELNGDFYYNGTTAFTGGTEIGVGEDTTIKFSASKTYSSNFFAYCNKEDRFYLNNN